MKRCVLCKTSHPLTEFNFKRDASDLLQNVCRDCNRKRSARYYSENRESHKRFVARRTREAQRFIALYLTSNPCVDCGESDIRVLEFDHRPTELKIDELGKLARSGATPAAMAAEIAKCDVRCRNCHVRMTYARARSSWRREAFEAAERASLQHLIDCELEWIDQPIEDAGTEQ